MAVGALVEVHDAISVLGDTCRLRQVSFTADVWAKLPGDVLLKRAVVWRGLVLRVYAKQQDMQWYEMVKALVCPV